MRKKALVTGGAGFIGSNLVRELVRKNYLVVVVDDLSMGTLRNFDDLHNIIFYKHSVTDKLFMRQLCSTNCFEYIYLLAAIASVPDSISRPFQTHDVNFEANLNILSWLSTLSNKPQKILFTSSAAVYGSNPQLPSTEDDVLSPESPYAIDKYSVECYMDMYKKFYGLNTVCVRFFNVYGPRQNPKSPYSGVLSLLKRALISQEEFSVFGDGSQTRDYVYVKDVVIALLGLSGHADASGTFNIGTGRQTSLNDLIHSFEQASHSKLQVNYKDARTGDVHDSVANIDKIKLLNLTPKTSLMEGLINYWDSENKV